MNPIEKIQRRLAPVRTELLNHPVYARLDRIEALRVFMQHHVFAVWDFMSLLKTLQQRLTCTQTPWLPPANQIGCRLVNEIVLGEESDEDGHGSYASHFELYLRSMQRCGASTALITSFLDRLRTGASVAQALQDSDVPAPITEFVTHTFSVIATGNVCAVASVFAFGREDLLPDVFQAMVNKLQIEQSADLSDFLYYLERHIAVDGDQHGPMAASLLEHLCAGDAQNWQLAEDAAFDCLTARHRLWDAINNRLSQ